MPALSQPQPLNHSQLWQQPHLWRLPTATAAAQTLTQAVQHLPEEKAAVQFVGLNSLQMLKHQQQNTQADHKYCCRPEHPLSKQHQAPHKPRATSHFSRRCCSVSRHCDTQRLSCESCLTGTRCPMPGASLPTEEYRGCSAAFEPPLFTTRLVSMLTHAWFFTCRPFCLGLKGQSVPSSCSSWMCTWRSLVAACHLAALLPTSCLQHHCPG